MEGIFFSEDDDLLVLERVGGQIQDGSHEFDSCAEDDVQKKETANKGESGPVVLHIKCLRFGSTSSPGSLVLRFPITQAIVERFVPLVFALCLYVSCAIA